MTVMGAPPKSGTRGVYIGPSEAQANAEANAAKDSRHLAAQQASMERRAWKGVMPKHLGVAPTPTSPGSGLLAWYAEGWDAEVPERLHTVEVWNGRQQWRTVEVDGRRRVAPVWPDELVGGSGIGSHAETSLFRRYLEGYAAERDADGYYLRPMHAALGRLATRDHWMARNLFALAQSGYEWRTVADAGHWVHGMYVVYIEEALRRLWREHSDIAVRLS